MTNIFFTADCHFNHANIILPSYANRPFLKHGDTIGDTNLWKSYKIKSARCNWMNEEIIKRWNHKVKPNDIVYHLGDFCFKGNSKEFEDKLNGKIIHIMGNHDYNNGVKSLIKCCIMEFGNMVFLVQHVPPTMDIEIPEFVDVVLCGHVHQHWKLSFSPDTKVPIINVGVDVWNFEPVSIHSILKYIKKIREGK